MAKLLELNDVNSYQPPVLSNTGDSRDFTKEPPALLDPLWVLRMRRRVTEYATTGNLDWYPVCRDNATP